ncbi:MAG: type II secretion system F family protein [Candidatus Pacebacteria bacterium]|nr:type II secretion system F family protein [Candidatus Paceibacterota bacterium]
MIFEFKSIKTNGETVEGKVEAESKQSVIDLIVGRGEQVVFVNEFEEKKLVKETKKAFAGLFGNIKEQDKILFARNLGLMIKAGLALSRALSVLERQSSNKTLKKITAKIQEDISKGKTFHEALSEHPKVFSKLFISMVAAGEESGNLANSLENISSQMEKTHKIVKKVKGAMVYPAVVIGVMIIIAILMLFYIVPTLTETFKSLEVELPFTTRMVIGLSDIIRDHSIIFFASLVLVIVLLFSFFKTKKGKRTLDFCFLHFPIVKNITKGVNSARTTRTLSSLLQAGVDYVEAINITERVVQNSYYRTVLKDASKKVEKGEPISKVFLDNSNLYPIFVGEMASVGEETGNISEMLQGVALFYEEEVEQKTKDMSALVEPMLMIVIGIAVGFFAVSMLTPTYSLVDAI